MWQFWIDVGGTFTDCLALSPNGKQHLTKVLSSGRVKGTVEYWTQPRKVFFSSYFVGNINCPNFWTGSQIFLMTADGKVVHEAKVAANDYTNGYLTLDQPFVAGLEDQIATFELDPGWHSPVLAIREIMSLSPEQPLPDCRVHLGTTRGTNALLTRSGAATALITTAGFKDMLRIGDQARPELFRLAIEKPESLFSHSIEIDERVLFDGTVERTPTEEDVHQALSELREHTDVQSIAVCLMHGYRYPEHEKMVGRIARAIGFENVRLSHEVAPLIKIIPRGETTVLDAYLNPVIGRYLDEIQSSLSGASQLRLMTSSGGLVSRERFSGKDSVLSGPAGGVVGAARVAEQAGYERAIAFDMGGTSTDVARYDGRNSGGFEMDFETRKAGVRIVNPMLAIETVAAGGGSICKFDGSKLTVGPQSATSIPGPACYGAGGPLTVTDVNLFLGRIVEDDFPFYLDRVAVQRRLDEIVSEMRDAEFEITCEAVALGFLEIANQNMAAAIRCVSVAKGYDPQDYVLVSFGGAGSQHCCAVASALGMTQILDHPQGSILSAVGIRLADQTASRVVSVMKSLTAETLIDVKQALGEMRAEVESQFENEAIEASVDPEVTFSLDLRYQGTEPTETINGGEIERELSVEEFESLFADVHQQRYGYVQNRPLEIANARVTGRVVGNRLPESVQIESRQIREPDERSDLLVSLSFSQQAESPGGSDYERRSVGVFERDCLQPGDQIVGPAIVGSQLTTTIVDDGWSARLLNEGQLLIERLEGEPKKQVEPLGVVEGSNGHESEHDTNVDPVQLEIFNNHFSSIARQMGISLQKTSTSVNVKERLDFSCAVFTGDGQLVVNAPHIPVHLGAMSHTVRATINDNPTVKPGDVWVTNDPYRGGSHLPDITVLTPVFVGDESKQPNFWVASRSHHAEVGGRTPGSMPADAICLEEEGVLIQNFKLIDAGCERFDELKMLLSSGRYPSRSPDENIADLTAQVAANRSGEIDLLRLVDRHGLQKVTAYMKHIQDAAERKVRQALAKIPDGEFEFSDAMDVANSSIRVLVIKQGEQLKIDFTGTDPVLPSNLNANAAIVSAAVMYVMRCLIADDIPLNEGMMKPVEIQLPECLLNPTPADDPANSPAIVGGNVETSQRVVDVILGALGLAAASQGTMNNWLMGDQTFGYYETVCGGSGATPGADGASAVHTHMTNTRLTDPEILEARYPAILREFSIRPSGGAGAWRGGDGIRREVEFTRELTVSLLTSRRERPPFGLNGGSAGAVGENLLLRASGAPLMDETKLKSQCEIQVSSGDRLILLTPGGGGFGDEEDGQTV